MEKSIALFFYVADAPSLTLPALTLIKLFAAQQGDDLRQSARNAHRDANTQHA